MTVTTTPPSGDSAGERRSDEVTVTIDGFELTVPKGTLVIRVAELLGVQIPRFCDHPLLDPIGACRQCIVEIDGQRKPQTACTTPVADGMVVHTQLTSAVADKAQQGTMELLLINHPLDCPVCDKGGECPLQNQAMSNGRPDSRFRDVKRTFRKPIAISSQVLLDRERCVLCARCTRFSQQIAGDPFIELFERGALEQVAVYEDEPFQSYFSGNTVQICPVGALTGAQYRFRARPFDLQSTSSVCEHCASGCAQRTDWRRGRVTRRLAADDPAVNEEWNCDKGRWAFTYATAADRITTPLVREDGYLVETSWTDALERAAAGLSGNTRVGLLPGGRLTYEDAYAWSKFARTVTRTNDIDFRARPHSVEEAEFLAAAVAGRGVETTYTDLDKAPVVLLVGFDPEEESPIVFLRLRKAVRAGLRVASVAPMTTRALRKLSATMLRAAPGTEAEVVSALSNAGTTDGLGAGAADVAELLRKPGAVILVGERLAAVPGGFSAAARLAADTGAKLAWVPRRAGDRGAVEAGLLPNVLPGGRPVTAAQELGWSGAPTTHGRALDEMIAAAQTGGLDALVVGATDPYDLPDPAAALDALESVGFVVSLEIRESAVTARADVILPVAAAVEKAGSFLNWEGRRRPFGETLPDTGTLTDARVLHLLAAEMGTDLALPDVDAIRAELDRVGTGSGDHQPAPAYNAGQLPQPQRGEAVLATWPLLLDAGRLQDGEPHLAGTAKQATALLSAATAEEVGVTAGQRVRVSSDRGSITLPVEVADLPDRVVWLPTNSADSAVRRDLAAGSGAVVRLSVGGAS
jgi:NADH-quinone oxidoreductase subunit G